MPRRPSFLNNVSFPKISGYCTPAKVYLTLAIFSIALTLVQNVGMRNVFRLGNMKTYVENTYTVIIFEIVYLFAWGWFIDWLCRKRVTNLAWFIVVLPYALAILAFMGYYNYGGITLHSFA